MLMNWTSITLLKSFQKLLSVWKGEKVLVRQNFVLTYWLIIWQMKYLSISAYTHIRFDAFYMDKSYSLSTPMIMRSLEINNDSVWSQKKDEELLDDETPYLGAIRALVHLTNNITRYLSCSKFTGKIQFLPDKRTLKWCWAHD